MKTPDDAMTLTEHLGELRVRIIRSALAVMLVAIIIIAFYDPVLDFLLAALRSTCASSKATEFCGFDAEQRATRRCSSSIPLEGLSTRLRVATYGGLILAMPVILWQVWRFIVPALHAKEKRYAIPFILSSVAAVPARRRSSPTSRSSKALEFLISWAGTDVGQRSRSASTSASSTLMVAAFGIGFQFPVLLVFLQLVGVVTPQQLLKGWRYAIVGIVVVAAVITPSGDPISLRRARRADDVLLLHRRSCIGLARSSVADAAAARPPSLRRLRRRGASAIRPRPTIVAGYPFPLDRFQLEAHRRPRRRAPRRRRRADRQRQDGRRRVRHRGDPPDGPAGVLHGADQGAVEPEVPRPRRALRRRRGRPADRRQRDQRRRARSW